MVSTTTALASTPASNASMPVLRIMATTASRASLSPPHTRTSVSIFESNFSSCSGEMFWNAATTLVFSPKYSWTSAVMEPLGLSFARLFLSGSRDDAMLMTILPWTAVLRSSRIGFIPSYGIESKTTSAFVAASRLVYPSTFLLANFVLMMLAVFWAFKASREPIRTWTPAFANRAAMALPSLPVPPITASERLRMDIFFGSPVLDRAFLRYYLFLLG